MAVYEQSTLLRCKDENGNEYLLYPITKLDCVDGAEDLVHYDKDQELTAGQKAQFLKNIGGLCAPVSAQANQFLKVSAVDEHGNVTAVETAEGPTEASAVDIYTQADEPVGAEDGSIWFNTGNADGTISILVRRNGSWEISSDGVAQVQPDWDETDASNPGYVRNKPFGYAADLYANSTLPFAVGTNKNNIYSASLPTGLLSSLQEGDNVTVVWDGTVYELTAKEVWVTNNMSVSNALGNGRILSESFGANLATDTGEPFAIIPAFNIIYTRSTMSTHSLQIKDDETIVKIDVKFLPDEALNASVQSDWDETDENSAAFILNKPEIPDTDNFATKDYVQEQLSGVSAPDMTGYAKSEDIPTTVSELENDAGYLTEQVQPDWDETDVTSPAYIKNKPVISADGGASVQANWEQNDESQPDFIKNKPFGLIVTEKAILSEMACDFAYSSELGAFIVVDTEPEYTFEAGQDYKVVWDGNEYIRTAFEFIAAGGAECIAVGNPIVAGMEDNGDIFSIVHEKTNNVILHVSSEQVLSHTVAVYQDSIDIDKLDAEYLPEEVATKTYVQEEISKIGVSALPEVTSSDVGKFLRVGVGGVWAVESIPNAEEASF